MKGQIPEKALTDNESTKNIKIVDLAKSDVLVSSRVHSGGKN